MNEDEEKLVNECIESHRRMIMHHRRAIINLTRKKLTEPELCSECLDIKIKK